MSDDFDPNAPMQPNIPVTFKANGQTIGAKSQLIKEPTPGETNLFSNQRVKTCGDCKFFDKNERTMQKFRQTDLYRKLKFDYKWRSKYLPGGNFEELGICAQKQDTVVGPVSRACEYHKAKR